MELFLLSDLKCFKIMSMGRSEGVWGNHNENEKWKGFKVEDGVMKVHEWDMNEFEEEDINK